MKTTTLRKERTALSLFLLLFFCGVNMFAFGSVSQVGSAAAQPLTAGEKTEDPDRSDPSGEGLSDRKSFFESKGGSPIFEKEDEDMLNAPPTFDDGEIHPPGGQVNPKLSMGDAFPELLLLVFGYTVIRLFRNKRIV